MASSQDFNQFYEHRASVLGTRPQQNTTKFHLIKTLLNQKKDTILDIGCGRGEILIPLRQQGYTILGIDSCQTNVGLLLPLGVKCDNCTSQRKYYSLFNTFLILDLLEHLNEDEEKLLFQNLKQSPKHKVILCVPNEEDLKRKSVVCPQCTHKFHPYGHLRSLSMKDISFFLEDCAGYEILRTYYLPNWLNVKLWFIPLLVYKFMASFAWDKGNLIIEARKK